MKSQKAAGGLRNWMWIVPAIVSCFLVAATAWAQVGASMSGRVEDASGAGIPKANVTVTSLETGAARTVTTDEAGNYRVLSLPVGQYEARAEKAGFNVQVQKGINLVVGQAAVVNLKLEVSAVQQEVTVTADVPVVNTTTASVSGLVGEREVKDLPLNGRSFDNLITLNTGAVNFTSHTQMAALGDGYGNYFAVSGRRAEQNLFLLNGVEYTSDGEQGVTPGGASGQLLGIDAVREFNVLTDSYSAEYGKRPGGQVSIVTQSGTNQLHGTVFEFLRNSAMDARNFFDYPIGMRIPAFQRNQFGGAAGGPIRKDKTFIFGNYEGFRQRLGISDVTVVPDANARQGLLPNAQGVPTLVTGLNRGMLPYMAFWPQPTRNLLVNGLPTGVALAYSNPKQMIREDFGTLRLDERLSDHDSLAANYTIDDGENLTPLTNPLFGGFGTVRSQVISLQEQHVFSPELINTARVGFSRGGFFYDTPPLASFPANLSLFAGKEPGGLNVGAGTGGGSVGALTSVGSVSMQLCCARNLYTYSDDVQKVHGKHQLSFGVWFQRMQDNRRGAARQAGLASFATLQSFLQGTVVSFTGVPNPTLVGYRMLMGAWYVQDNITLTPNLTLRVGLRHEFTNGWNEVLGREAAWISDSNGVLQTNPKVGNVYTENNAKRLFGPRVGLAWDPFGKGKTSIRAGFGTYYHLQDAIGFQPDSSPPYNANLTFGQNTSLLPLVPVLPGVPAPPACGPGVPQPCSTFAPQGVQSSLKTPTVEEWNLTVEQQVSPNTSLRVAYVGSHGYHQMINIDPNAIRPLVCASAAGCPSGGTSKTPGLAPQGALYVPLGTRPNPYLANGYFWYSEGNSSYNALQLDVTRRFSHGLQFRGNYTWAKNLDDGSALSIAQAANTPQQVMTPYTPMRDWGPAATDIRHQASISGGYQLPFGQGKPWLSGLTGPASKLASGWQVNWIISLLSGFPFTPQVGSNQSGDGNSRNPDRPNLLPGRNLDNMISGTTAGCSGVAAGQKLGTPNLYFDPCAFALPTIGTWGNVGRDSLRGPGLGTLDMSLFKNTTITERIRLEFRAEVFNLLNRANFSTPNPIIFSGGAVSPSAGIISATATESRRVQFGLKLSF